MMNWQPIATAPKDGTRVMTYVCAYKRHWFGTGYYFKGVPGDGEGWVAHSFLTTPKDDCGGSFNPSHWMPLLEPPKLASSGAVPLSDEKEKKNDDLNAALAEGVTDTTAATPREVRIGAKEIRRAYEAAARKHLPLVVGIAFYWENDMDGGPRYQVCKVTTTASVEDVLKGEDAMFTDLICHSMIGNCAISYDFQHARVSVSDAERAEPLGRVVTCGHQRRLSYSESNDAPRFEADAQCDQHPNHLGSHEGFALGHRWFWNDHAHGIMRGYHGKQPISEAGRSAQSASTKDETLNLEHLPSPATDQQERK